MLSFKNSLLLLIGLLLLGVVFKLWAFSPGETSVVINGGHTSTPTVISSTGDSSGDTIFTFSGVESLEVAASYVQIENKNFSVVTSGEYFLQHAVNFNGSTGVIYEFSPLINGTPVNDCNTREQSNASKPYSNSAGCLVNLTTGDIVSYGVKIT
jgi:hypothetical protein